MIGTLAAWTGAMLRVGAMKRLAFTFVVTLIVLPSCGTGTGDDLEVSSSNAHGEWLLVQDGRHSSGVSWVLLRDQEQYQKSCFRAKVQFARNQEIADSDRPFLTDESCLADLAEYAIKQGGGGGILSAATEYWYGYVSDRVEAVVAIATDGTTTQASVRNNTYFIIRPLSPPVVNLRALLRGGGAVDCPIEYDDNGIQRAWPCD